MRYLSVWHLTLALLAVPGSTHSSLEERPSLRAGLPSDVAEVALSAPPAIPTEDITGLFRVSLPPLPSVDAVMAAPPPLTRGRGMYRALVAREARQQGIPPEIVDGVVQIESGYNALAVGTVGEVGLMQIRPETARMLGFAGATADLFQADVNVHYAATYLAGAWRLARGDLCRTLMKYRAGHGEERMSTLSVDYCRRVRAHLEAIGSPLALAVIPKADFVSPGTGPILSGPAISRTGTASLAAMATWRRNGQTSGRLGSSAAERRLSGAPPASAYIEANRTPFYKALLRGRS